jgi:hypothetical protein
MVEACGSPPKRRCIVNKIQDVRGEAVKPQLLSPRLKSGRQSPLSKAHAEYAPDHCAEPRTPDRTRSSLDSPRETDQRAYRTRDGGVSSGTVLGWFHLLVGANSAPRRTIDE